MGQRQLGNRANESAAPLTYFVNLYLNLLFVISLGVCGPWPRKARLTLALELDSNCLDCGIGLQNEEHPSSHEVEVGMACIGLVELNPDRHGLTVRMQRCVERRGLICLT
jgi:hypothetical protein